MLDRQMRSILDPVLGAAGAWLAARGLAAEVVTLTGAALGLAAAAAVALGAPLVGLALLLASRLADGLDGPVARAQGQGGVWGAHLDILADFVVYAALPLGFVIADPSGNGAAGAFLLGAFYVNSASFLGYAIMAERLGLESRASGRKGFFHATGLIEGTETIAFLALACLVPDWFAPLAWGFGALCLLTAVLRSLEARRRFARTPQRSGATGSSSSTQ
jgi:phosphatidylglycerophosphate synthase